MAQSRPTSRTAPFVFAASLLAAACAKSDDRWLEELADPDPFVRGTAAIALTEQAPHRADPAVDVLIQSLDGPEDPVRAHAGPALVKAAPWTAGRLLRHLVEEGALSEDARAAILDALAASGEVAIPLLIEAMRHPGGSNVRELGMVLVRIGDPSVEPLTTLLRTDPDPAMQRCAAYLLGQMGVRGRSAVPALVLALEKGPPYLALLSVQSLQRVDPDGGLALPVLRAALARDDPSLRAAAAEAVARAQIARAETFSPEARAAALREVGRCGDAALPALIDGLASPIPMRKDFARDALLGAIARFAFEPRPAEVDGRRIALLIKNLEHDVPATRGLSALDLGRMGRGAGTAVPSLLDSMRDRHPEVRTCVALALWLIALDVCREELVSVRAKRAGHGR